MPSGSYKKGGDCGCSKISGGGNFFESTANTSNLNLYPYNSSAGPNDPSQIQSVRMNPDIPFSARGGGGSKASRRKKRGNTKKRRQKKRYCKGGYNDRTDSITNNYVLDNSIVQAPNRLLVGGKTRKMKNKRKYKKGGDMLSFFYSNPVTSFGSMNGWATSTNILYGQGQSGDHASYNTPMNNPYQKYYI